MKENNEAVLTMLFVTIAAVVAVYLIHALMTLPGIP